MLNISLKSTYQDPDGFDWEYYQDDVDASTYYILPRPEFVTTDGKPSFQLVTYTTDTPATNGSGYCRFDVELAVPTNVQAAIQQQIQQGSPGVTPVFKALDENAGGQASVLLSNATKTVTATTPVSGFGSDVASFVLHLTADQVDTLRAAFSTSGGAVEAEYQLSVPARLPAVKAVMSFDSSIAYSYQVTQPSYNEWGDETSPGSVQKLLNESQSSKVDLTWGVAAPSADLQQAVAQWANDTLADQVQAEVQQTIALQGLSSDNSFAINEVSSFTSEYDANQVVDWLLRPSRTLPSFPDMGLQMADYESTVNQQQQVMHVTTQLPFASDSDTGQDVPVERLTVTARYPGLGEKDATHVFTANGGCAFVAPFDVAQGPAWDLEYVATYAGSTAPVSGVIKGIDQGSYTLTLPDVGILSVAFDASDAFSANEAPGQVELTVTYPNFDGHGNPFNEKLTLTPDRATGKVRSVGALPLDAGYNWQASYAFGGTATVTGTLNQGSTGTQQRVPAAAGVHQTKIFVVVPPESDTVVLEADVSVYYQGEPQAIPGAPASAPTKESPAVYQLVPSGKGKTSFASETFYGLVNGNQPLVYSATITTETGQILIDDQPVANDVPSILVNPTQRYFTIEVTPESIDWDSAGFTSVSVLVTPSGINPAPGQHRPLTWNKGETGSQYITWSIQDTDTVTYSWYATYCVPGTGNVQTTAVASATDVLLAVPAGPPSNASVTSFAVSAVVPASSLQSS